MSTQIIQIQNYQSENGEPSIAFTPVRVKFRTEVLNGGIEMIEKIFDEWTDLCDQAKNGEPFCRPEWFASLVKSFDIKIILITVRRGAELRAVLPLTLTRENLHSIPTRKLKGVFNLQSQRFDLIHGADEAEREQICAEIWKAIKKIKGWDIFETRLVKKDSWLADLIESAKRENYPTGSWKMDAAPYVALPQGEDKEKLIADYFKNLSKNRRKLVNKNRRKLKEIGIVETCVTRGFTPELLQKYFSLEDRSWKARAGTAVNCDSRAAQLHEEFARAVAARNALFIHELKLDGRTIAMYLSIMFDDGKTIGWKMSYDENYANYSPGNILFIEVLNECMRRNSPELDQLSPANYNKSLWASGEYEHSALYIFQRGIFGWLLMKWKFVVIEYLRQFKKSKN